MSRTFSAILRFIVGLVFIVIFLRFLGITWADVDFFLDNGLKRAFDIFREFQGIAS